MHRRLKQSSWVAALLLLVTAAHVQAATYRPRSVISAKAAILVDTQTGKTLWEYNPDTPLPPASTTKVMTALLAMESGRLNDTFAVSDEAAAEPPTKVGLRSGWRMKLDDLVYALLLNSANDASVVIAEGLSGSVPEFARRMNAKARALGARNTHFANPNGLPNDEHYSSARDLATFFHHAMRDPRFAQVVNTKRGEIWPASGSRRRIALRNHNRLLGEYPIHVVGKTGWTRSARKCFVGQASSDGRELTFAILGSTDIWGDIKRLLSFGFDGTEPLEADPTALQMAAIPNGDVRGGGDKVESNDGRGGKYSVRLGTFSSLRSANKVKTSAKRKGYPARIVKVRHRRKSVYRVAVGQYDNRRDAQRAARELTNMHGNASAFIVSGR
ncbi:MAG: D-alanyl-D-alanine carboxypeptidase [Deltaproteobacteria bacterium]|nr:D-alanyl-D-alanine carboxypeptidase [Deltaproteobacteria bacterium]